VGFPHRSLGRVATPVRPGSVGAVIFQMSISTDRTGKRRLCPAPRTLTKSAFPPGQHASIFPFPFARVPAEKKRPVLSLPLPFFRTFRSFGLTEHNCRRMAPLSSLSSSTSLFRQETHVQETVRPHQPARTIGQMVPGIHPFYVRTETHHFVRRGSPAPLLRPGHLLYPLFLPTPPMQALSSEA